MTERRQRLALLAPYAAGIVLLIAVPALVNFGLAFFDYDLLTPPEWSGFANFRELVADPAFVDAVQNSLLFAALAVPLRLAGALGLALLLHARFRGARVHRTIAYLPTIVPEAAYVLLWLFLLNPLYGPVNVLLGGLGLGQPEWLTDPTAARATMVLIACFTVGEGFIVALAVRSELPGELYELARVEGASALMTFRRVTLPLMAPVIGLLALCDAAFTLQISFGPAYLLTNGGPDRATLFLPLYVYDVGFEQLRYGYGAAMTLAMFLATLLLVAAAALLARGRRLRTD